MSFMNDYVLRVMFVFLVMFLSECVCILVVDVCELCVMMMYGMMFVVNVCVLVCEVLNWWGIFVDLSGYASESAIGTAATDAWECV